MDSYKDLNILNVFYLSGVLGVLGYRGFGVLTTFGYREKYEKINCYIFVTFLFCICFVYINNGLK